jgi:hypothetical protein
MMLLRINFVNLICIVNKECGGLQMDLSGELLLLRSASTSARETFFSCVSPDYLTLLAPVPSQMEPTYFDRLIPATNNALI